MKMIQVVLARRLEGEKLATMVTWLPTDKRIKKGVSVKLKGKDEWWEVALVFSTEAEMNEIDNRGWDNNNYDKHDGTSMKARTKK